MLRLVQSKHTLTHKWQIDVGVGKRHLSVCRLCVCVERVRFLRMIRQCFRRPAMSDVLISFEWRAPVCKMICFFFACAKKKSVHHRLAYRIAGKNAFTSNSFAHAHTHKNNMIKRLPQIKLLCQWSTPMGWERERDRTESTRRGGLLSENRHVTMKSTPTFVHSPVCWLMRTHLAHHWLVFYSFHFLRHFQS